MQTKSPQRDFDAIRRHVLDQDQLYGLAGLRERPGANRTRCGV
jgi:hypothetical protein